jgi:iron complex outermembrane receptor protein
MTKTTKMIPEKAMAKALRMVFSGTAMAAGVGLSGHAVAQDAPAAPVARVEVTGSAIRRVDAETALPVQMVSAAEIARSGATSTEELLSMVSSLSSAGGTVNATGAGTSTGGLSSISLRGLGSNRTLVLVNGRRLAAFANEGGSVNINVIPLAAIERVEVLKAGASGLYGSDAIAGVVNFILKKHVEGIEVEAGYGSPSHKGGGQNTKASVIGGFTRGDLDVVLSGSYEKDRVLFGRDRSYASTATRLPYYSGTATGTGNIQGNYVPSPGSGKQPGFSSGGSGYGNPLADPDKCGTIGMAALQGGAKGAPYCYYDSAPDVGLLPDRELVNFTGNLTYKLNANTELFADGLWSQSRVTQIYQPSPARASFFETDGQFATLGVAPALLVFPNNPAYQNIAAPYLISHGFGSLVGQPIAVTQRVFDFGPRQNKDTALQGRLSFGARGTVSNQDYSISLSHNESRLNSAVGTGYFSQVAYAAIVNDPNSNWNPWIPGGVQTGALAQKIKTAAFTGSFLDATSKSDILDAQLSGDLFQVAGITPQYAVGMQSRHEKFVTSPSSAYMSGDISGLGGSVVPVDRSRQVNSVYGEINLPLLKTLEVGLNVRNDHYNDVGGSTNYTFKTRWQPIQSVVLRGSYGTGFRAPSLLDLWTPQTLGTSETFNDPATGQSGIQVNALTGGNPKLTPEKSKQFALGAVIQPTSTTNIGLDFFRIKVRDIISTPSAQEIVSRFRSGDGAYKNLVTLEGNEVSSIVSILSNTGEANLQGVDVFANWRGNFDFGRIDVGMNGTYMDKYDQMSPGGQLSHKVGTMVESNGDPVIGAQNGGVILRWKHQLAATWTKGVWAGTLVQRFRSGYQVGHDLNDERVFFGRESIFDANLTYRGLRNATLAIGVKNLFDKQPSIPGQAVTNQFQSGYDINQYDPRGRFVYVTAGFKFK